MSREEKTALPEQKEAELTHEISASHRSIDSNVLAGAARAESMLRAGGSLFDCSSDDIIQLAETIGNSAMLSIIGSNGCFVPVRNARSMLFLDSADINYITTSEPQLREGRTLPSPGHMRPSRVNTLKKR